MSVIEISRLSISVRTVERLDSTMRLALLQLLPSFLSFLRQGAPIIPQIARALEVKIGAAGFAPLLTAAEVLADGENVGLGTAVVRILAVERLLAILLHMH